MKKAITFSLLWLALLATSARAEVKTKEIEYKQGDTPLKGFLAYDDAAKGKRPAVLVVHEWWGMNQHARNQAIRLAKAGYVGFAVDMYGNGKIATHPKDAMAFMQEATKDPKVLVERFNIALDLLKQQPQVDTAKIAAIGYCFGGGVVLAMARSGAELAAVATFHGHLSPDAGPVAQKGKVKPKILVQTGSADAMVPTAQVDAFKKEMADAGVDAKVIVYPNIKHSFTNPDAAKAGMKELAYDADTDKKSWAELLKFFKQTFGS